jgi:hypothetical protein
MIFGFVLNFKKKSIGKNPQSPSFYSLGDIWKKTERVAEI